MTESTKKQRGWLACLFAGLVFFAGGYFGVPALQNPAVAIKAGDVMEERVTDLLDDDEQEEAQTDGSGGK